MMARRRIHFAFSVESLERSETVAEERPLLEFEFADTLPEVSSRRAETQQRRAATIKERIARWLERKL